MVKKKQATFESIMGRIKPKDLLRASDFESVEIKFIIQNVMTKIEVRETDTARIQILEILPKGLILELPRKSCSGGHSLLMEIIARIPRKKDLGFRCTAKVEEAEPISDSFLERVKLSFVQFNEKEWLKLCGIFAGRQVEIARFLSAARGY